MAGISISLEKADINGLKQVGISSNTPHHLVANTNQFKVFQNYGIGKFKITSSLKVELEKLDLIYNRVTKIDNKLKINNSSFGKLNPIIGHATYIQIGEYKIPQTHMYYTELYDLFTTMVANIKLTKIDVVVFNEGKNGPQYTYYKNDKIVKERPISFNFHCDMIDEKRICFVKKYGHLTVDK